MAGQGKHLGNAVRESGVIPRKEPPPGLFRCPHCGEALSSPAWLYTCPRRPDSQA